MRVPVFASFALVLFGCHASEQADQTPSNRLANEASVPANQPARLSNTTVALTQDKGALGAARQLRAYCDYLANKKFSEAYAMWSDRGRASGLSREEFTARLVKYRSFDCYLGTPGGMEGAAGSVYVEIPLKVSGYLTDGRPFTREGPVTMRRVNDVPGSTEEQRQWHIQSSALEDVPGS